MPERRGTHVILADNGARGKCLHCGGVITFTLPMPLDEYAKQSLDFAHRHEGCPAPEPA